MVNNVLKPVFGADPGNCLVFDGNLSDRNRQSCPMFGDYSVDISFAISVTNSGPILDPWFVRLILPKLRTHCPCRCNLRAARGLSESQEEHPNQDESRVEVLGLIGIYWKSDSTCSVLWWVAASLRTEATWGQAHTFMQITLNNHFFLPTRCDAKCVKTHITSWNSNCPLPITSRGHRWHRGRCFERSIHNVCEKRTLILEVLSIRLSATKNIFAPLPTSEKLKGFRQTSRPRMYEFNLTKCHWHAMGCLLLLSPNWIAKQLP